jgi:hypothetical protein
VRVVHDEHGAAAEHDRSCAGIRHRYLRNRLDRNGRTSAIRTTLAI